MKFSIQNSLVKLNEHITFVHCSPENFLYPAPVYNSITPHTVLMWEACLCGKGCWKSHWQKGTEIEMHFWSTSRGFQITESFRKLLCSGGQLMLLGIKNSAWCIVTARKIIEQIGLLTNVCILYTHTVQIDTKLKFTLLVISYYFLSLENSEEQNPSYNPLKWLLRKREGESNL